MPETVDSAGSPEFTELPALHTPAKGEGSKTPPDPSKLTAGPPIGDAKAPSPMGSPGAPAGGGPGGAGAPQPEQQTPEDKLNEDTLDSLRQDIRKIVNRDEIENLDDLIDTLLDEGWRTNRINDLIDNRDVDTTQQLFNDVLNKNYKEEAAPGEEIPAQLPPAGDVTGPPDPTQLSKKPDNDQTGVNLKTTQVRLQKLKRGELMTKKVTLKDGTLIVKEATDASAIIEGIASARRKVDAALKNYTDTKIKKAGMEALGMGDPMGGMDDVGAIMGVEMDNGPGDGMLGAIKLLTEAVTALLGEISKGEGMDDLSSDDDIKLDSVINQGKDSLNNVKEMGPAADKEEDDDDDDAENDIPKAAGEEPGETKEAGKGSQEAMDVAMGKKGPKGKKDDKKPKKDKKDKKADVDVNPVIPETPAVPAVPVDPAEKVATPEIPGETPAVPAEGAAVATPAEGEAVTSASIIDKIKERVAIMKEANLYPFTDLNKQQVDNINATTAKDQIKTINSEISGGNQPSAEDRGDSISPTDIADNLTASKGKISMEAAERIKQHSIGNSVSKAKLSVELAARQQLKGLLSDPLREAMVKNIVEAKVCDEQTATAIVHNAFIDGYEASQKVILKEAFETFMDKDLNDFIKVAEFTEGYRIKESTPTPVEEGDNSSRVKSASVTGAPLRGTQVASDKKGDYRNYWEDVSRERRAY